MVAESFKDRVAKTLAGERWSQAQVLIERALKLEPENHWLLTQLGVTLYEQKRYTDAFKVLMQSKELVDDCPLTRWNLAGTFDMLKLPHDAIGHYEWILNHSQSPHDDPCWESVEWSTSLQADCLFRLGHCYRQLKRYAKAARCFRQYLELLMMGVEGIYTAGDATQALAKLRAKPSPGNFARQVSDIIQVATNGKRPASSVLTNAQ